MGGDIRLDLRQGYAAGLEWSLSTFSEALAADDGLPSLNGHSVPSHLTHFASLEQGATELRTWETLAVPGLLQTPAYATAVERMSLGDPSETEVAQRVEFRLTRQQALTKPDPLHLFALLDASVLLRDVGGPDTMAEQLDHLRKVNERPNVHVRLSPLDSRALAGPGTFRLLSNDAGPYIATTESLAGILYLETPSVVSAYLALWSHLWECGADDLAQVLTLDSQRRLRGAGDGW